MKTLLSTAISIATRAHDGQFDKSGMPYILHPLKVMHYLKTDDEELMCIAVLHDVMEDCDNIFHKEMLENMPDRVIRALLLLNHREGDSYEDYIEEISVNKDAIRVKLCDLRHNMDIRRLKGVAEKDLQRLDKYSKAYQKLVKLI